MSVSPKPVSRKTASRKAASPKSASPGIATPKIEEYLEAIYLLNSGGKPTAGARLAELLKIKAPTVTEAVKRMQRDGYVAVDAAKGISLTPRGREVAESLIRRHRLSERLLTDILGVDWHTVHAEACKLEHVISPAVEEKIATALGNPTTCPHGNPIPGSSGEADPSGGRDFPLSQARAGQTLSVRRVSEETEMDADLLGYLNRLGLRPGARLTVKEIVPINGTVTLLMAGESVTLGLQVAGKLWVREEESRVESWRSSG